MKRERFPRSRDFRSPNQPHRTLLPHGRGSVCVIPSLRRAAVLVEEIEIRLIGDPDALHSIAQIG